MPLVGFMRAWAANREPSRVSEPLEAEGAGKMKTALGLYRGVGAGAGVTYLSLELADDFIALGMLDEAEAELDSGNAAMTKTGEDFFEPEYFRLRGKVCLARYESAQDKSHFDQADKLFRTALTTAQRIESKGLELRAAINRAGMLSLKGRHDEGIRLLEGILLRFDEVDDSEDFENARKLIKKMKKKSKQAE